MTNQKQHGKTAAAVSGLIASATMIFQLSNSVTTPFSFDKPFAPIEDNHKTNHVEMVCRDRHLDGFITAGVNACKNGDGEKWILTIMPEQEKTQSNQSYVANEAVELFEQIVAFIDELSGNEKTPNDNVKARLKAKTRREHGDSPSPLDEMTNYVAELSASIA